MLILNDFSLHQYKTNLTTSPYKLTKKDFDEEVKRRKKNN